MGATRRSGARRADGHVRSRRRRPCASYRRTITATRSTSIALCARSWRRHTVDAAVRRCRTRRSAAGFARTIAADSGKLPTIGDDDGGSLLAIWRQRSRGCERIAAACRAPSRRYPICQSVRRGDAVGYGRSAAGCASTVPHLAFCVRLPKPGYYVSRASGRSPDRRCRSSRLPEWRPCARRRALGHAEPCRVLPVPHRSRHRRYYTIDALAMTSARQNSTTRSSWTAAHMMPGGSSDWRSSSRSPRHGDLQQLNLFAGWREFLLRAPGRARCCHAGVLARRRSPARRGTHRADVHWHIDPGWRVTRTGSRAVRATRDDRTVWLLTLAGSFEVLINGDASPALGWCAPVYGRLIPTATVRGSSTTEAPFSIVTAIVEADAEPAIESLPLLRADGRQSHDGVAFRHPTARSAGVVAFTRWSGEASRGGCRRRLDRRRPFPRAPAFSAGAVCRQRGRARGSPCRWGAAGAPTVRGLASHSDRHTGAGTHMCGIAGFVTHDGGSHTSAAEATRAVRRMCDVIRHRGPDDEGIFVGEGAALGMRRLSIIDLAGGHQPLDGTLQVVFNGSSYLRTTPSVSSTSSGASSRAPSESRAAAQSSVSAIPGTFVRSASRSRWTKATTSRARRSGAWGRGRGRSRTPSARSDSRSSGRGSAA